MQWIKRERFDFAVSFHFYYFAAATHKYIAENSLC